MAQLPLSFSDRQSPPNLQRFYRAVFYETSTDEPILHHKWAAQMELR